MHCSNISKNPKTLKEMR